jgi:hypothetical protein
MAQVKRVVSVALNVLVEDLITKGAENPEQLEVMA